ncbi:MAG: response regulator [Planctomycetota bacterium]
MSNANGKAAEQQPADARVYVVDDDPLVRSALTRMFIAHRLHVVACEHARDFLECALTEEPSCLVLDVKMPELSGIELQEELVRRNVDLPIVFLTGHGDIPMTVRAMRLGAVDFLTKPVDPDQLCTTVRNAIEKHRERRAESAGLREFRQRAETLSARERQVMNLAVNGLLNKQIASHLGITLRTVKEHRGQVMRKTGVQSIAELARLCERAGIVAGLK